MSDIPRALRALPGFRWDQDNQPTLDWPDGLWRFDERLSDLAEGYYCFTADGQSGRVKVIIWPSKRIEIKRCQEDVEVRHCLAGPAVIEGDGSRVWYRAGVQHRDDGPAIEHADGTREWMHEGVRHREDGPAVVAKNYTRWYHEGEIHRDGAPAYESKDGAREWYQHGELHREGGPALITDDGIRMWYRRGKPHREDGPAVDAPEYAKWFIDGQLHREDGPAFEANDGSLHWYRRGHRHRADGPAVINIDGTREWWFGGKQLTEEVFARFYGPRDANQMRRIADAMNRR